MMLAMNPTSNYSITFGDCAEHRTGFGMLGNSLDKGFVLEDLQRASKLFDYTEIYDLSSLIPDVYKSMVYNKDAHFMYIKNGVEEILHDVKNAAWSLLQEQMSIPYDDQYYDPKKKRIFNMRARLNIVFDEERVQQNLSDENRPFTGNVIPWTDVPNLHMLKTRLSRYFGAKASNLKAEGNEYHTDKSGIGYHGDRERKIVIAVRLGIGKPPMPIVFQWFNGNIPIGDPFLKTIYHGDMYVMSDFAVGYNFPRGVHLRHAAGHKFYVESKCIDKIAKNGKLVPGMKRPMEFSSSYKRPKVFIKDEDDAIEMSYEQCD